METVSDCFRMADASDAYEKMTDKQYWDYYVAKMQILHLMAKYKENDSDVACEAAYCAMRLFDRVAPSHCCASCRDSPTSHNKHLLIIAMACFDICIKYLDDDDLIFNTSECYLLFEEFFPKCCKYNDFWSEFARCEVEVLNACGGVPVGKVTPVTLLAAVFPTIQIFCGISKSMPSVYRLVYFILTSFCACRDSAKCSTIDLARALCTPFVPTYQHAINGIARNDLMMTIWDSVVAFLERDEAEDCYYEYFAAEILELKLDSVIASFSKIFVKQ